MMRHLNVFMESLRKARTEERDAIKKDNTDFLPGALAVLETPPNPLGRTVLWVILGMLCLALLWAVIGHVDIVAVAQGRVIPDGRIKVVQASEDGIVRAIHTRDGQQVSAGDVLLELDPTMSEAEASHAREALATAEIDRARARALLEYINGQAGNIQLPKGTDPNIAITQTSVVAARIAEYKAERESAAQELSQHHSEKDVAAAEVSRLDQQLPLAEDQFRSMKDLEAKGYAARLRVAEVEERAIEARQNRVKSYQQLASIEAAERAAAERLAGVQNRFRRTALDEFNAADSTARLRQEELAIAQERSRRTVITAPVSGVVQQLQVSTIGAVVRPADTLLAVVPEGSTLVVEANLLNRDIGFVREGQQARVKFEAFPFTRYGVVPGTLTVLGRDAIQNEQLGLVFPTRIELSRFSIPVGEGRSTAISPGMAVSVEIHTGKRRIIEFLLSPLSRHVQEAGRER